MSNRNATEAVITEVAKRANQPFHLIQFVFDNETIYITDAYTTITWNGDDYVGVGHFLSFSDIEETATLQVSAITITLSGVDQTWISLFLNYDYIDRTVIIYKAFFDSAMDVISDPVLTFQGQMDEPAIAEDPDSGKSEVSIKATNHWADFERIPGRHTNHTEQQIHYPGDMGFEFASEIVKDITWGTT